MPCSSRLLSLLAPLAVAIAACGETTTPTTSDSAATSATQAGTAQPASAEAGSPFLRKVAADTPLSVVEARARSAGDEVVVAGRVKDVTRGFAAFKLIDASLKWCALDEGCPTPWDYCCTDPELVRAGTIAVELHDARGAPVAAEDSGVRPLDYVVVKGRLQATESGGVFLVADGGWDRRERLDYSQFTTKVEWPE